MEEKQKFYEETKHNQDQESSQDYEGIEDTEDLDDEDNLESFEDIITLRATEENTRIDIFISREIENLSRSRTQMLIDEQKVSVNKKYVKSNYRTKIDDVVEVTIPRPVILDIKPENIPVEIVYEDNDLAIINKPQGMVTHPAPGHISGTLVNALLYHLKNLSSINGVLRPGIVHRLDKNTSGLLIVAKNDKSHNYLASCLKAHTIDRYYYALVEGNMKEDNGTIDAPLGRDEKDRKKRAINYKNGKNAITNYSVIQRYNKYTLLKLKLETGRTHQIRVHLNFVGLPIIGDAIYGRTASNVNRVLLHSKITKIFDYTFEAREPKEFKVYDFS